jgi:hypothetical protein
MDHARPEEVAAIASGWSDHQLDCRVDRHDLRPLDASFNEEENTFTRTRRCRRCGVEQLQVWSARTGEILQRKMDYSGTDDYLMPKGTGVITDSSRNAIRLELLGRLQREAAASKKVAALSGRRRTTTRRATKKAS